MNNTRLNKTIRLKKYLLAAVSISSLTIIQHTQAAVVWQISQSGNKVTMLATGSLEHNGSVSTAAPVGGDENDAVYQLGSQRCMVMYGGDGLAESRNIGTAANLTQIQDSPILDTDPIGTDTFGFAGSTLIWDLQTFGQSPTTITPNSQITIYNTTVANVFGDLLNDGPVVAWTHNVTGDTIQYELANTTVTDTPEPCSAALLGLGGISLLLRRKRN